MSNHQQYNSSCYYAKVAYTSAIFPQKVMYKVQAVLPDWGVGQKADRLAAGGGRGHFMVNKARDVSKCAAYWAISQSVFVLILPSNNM